MRKIKHLSIAAAAFILSIQFCFSGITVYASGTVLKEGMRSEEVTGLQRDLKKLGYFETNPTGYYGGITGSAVRRLQKKYGLTVDGVTGSKTLALIDRLLSSSSSRSSVRQAVNVPSGTILKKGMSGSAVSSLQSNLKKFGFFTADVTGYYGSITVSAVKSFQKKYNLSADGIAGSKTLTQINKLLTAKSTNVSRSGSSVRTTAGQEGGYLAPWFDVASKVFSIGSVATVYDIDTGLTFRIKRAYGYNHADSETLTAEDTKIMKKIFGGEWSWSRRAVIINVDGRKMAASIAGMPHAGNDSYPANTYVSSRSGGYSGGTNLDTVKNNGMDGHFDVHFSGSRTHGTNRVDEAHQSMVKKAANWAKENNF
jgi:peptidoglycan hydrolase-like protein with peptidoglycan-binding domain